jgi:hypothetical protein
VLSEIHGRCPPAPISTPGGAFLALAYYPRFSQISPPAVKLTSRNRVPFCLFCLVRCRGACPINRFHLASWDSPWPGRREGLGPPHLAPLPCTMYRYVHGLVPPVCLRGSATEAYRRGHSYVPPRTTGPYLFSGCEVMPYSTSPPELECNPQPRRNLEGPRSPTGPSFRVWCSQTDPLPSSGPVAGHGPSTVG